MNKVILFIFILIFSKSYASVSPEEKILEISKLLKPISHQQWNLIAGDHIKETYRVHSGDTLWNISERLFGDSNYWPKIWALNHTLIKNPHMIYPGYEIAFLPGSGGTLPSFGPDGIETTTDADPQLSRSKEWEKLPRQKWENVSLEIPNSVDPDGFDRSRHVKNAIETPTVLPIFASSNEIESLGEVYGSRSEAEYLSLTDIVYLKNYGALQIGQEYSVTVEPNSIKSKRSDRLGFSYQNQGTVKILGTRDNLYVAEITSSHGLISRGDQIIPLIPLAPVLAPIPGPRPIEGTMTVIKDINTYTTAQHNFIHVDRGSQDGIEPGMVFRAYLHKDSVMKETITRDDFIIKADMIVLQVDDSHCTAKIIRSLNTTVDDQSRVVLLTDISDVFPGSRPSLSEDKELDETLDDELMNNDDDLDGAFDELDSDNELDELDELDPDNSIEEDEKKTLEQLEKWDQEDSELDEELNKSFDDEELDQIDTTNELDQELDSSESENLDSELDSELDTNIEETSIAPVEAETSAPTAETSEIDSELDATFDSELDSELDTQNAFPDEIEIDESNEIKMESPQN
tara:strand:+ start:110 stop:1831 length:1722 start_codon:yes stop_codon:yes gene_type:complete